MGDRHRRGRGPDGEQSGVREHRPGAVRHIGASSLEGENHSRRCATGSLKITCFPWKVRRLFSESAEVSALGASAVRSLTQWFLRNTGQVPRISGPQARVQEGFRCSCHARQDEVPALRHTQGPQGGRAVVVAWRPTSMPPAQPSTTSQTSQTRGQRVGFPAHNPFSPFLDSRFAASLRKSMTSGLLLCVSGSRSPRLLLGVLTWVQPGGRISDHRSAVQAKNRVGD